MQLIFLVLTVGHNIQYNKGRNYLYAATIYFILNAAITRRKTYGKEKEEI